MRVMDASIVVGLAAVVLIATMLGFTSKKEAAACINIFYDQPAVAGFDRGKKVSEVLDTVLNTVMPLSRVMRPIEGYQIGDLQKCRFNFYLGSYFENKLPRTFLADYVTAETTVVWLGYNIWQLGEQLERTQGLRFIRLTGEENRMYFSEVLYKGRVFQKGPGAFEQIELLPTNLEKFDAVAESRHPGTREIIPYIVRTRNRFYIADIPQDLEGSALFKEFLADIR